MKGLQIIMPETHGKNMKFSALSLFGLSKIISFVRSFVSSLVRLLARLSIRSFVRLFVCSLVYPYVRSFVCSFVRSLVRPLFAHFARLSVRSFSVSLIGWFVQVKLKEWRSVTFTHLPRTVPSSCPKSIRAFPRPL